MASLLAVGLGAVGLGLAARTIIRRGARKTLDFPKGGFKSKMDRKEALMVLGLK
jgi:DnaJ family protein C protein 19